MKSKNKHEVLRKVWSTEFKDFVTSKINQKTRFANPELAKVCSMSTHLEGLRTTPAQGLRGASGRTSPGFVVGQQSPWSSSGASRAETKTLMGATSFCLT